MVKNIEIIGWGDSCRLDPSETGLPSSPKLTTLALAGIGILGITLLARKRD